MAMDGIAISTERMATAGNGVTDVGTLLARELGTMENLLGQIRSGWRSDSAAPAFAATMHEYLEQATQLKAALVSHGATLLSTAGRFAEAENRLADGMRGGR
jgi:WXG100 family type VII secretion target